MGNIIKTYFINHLIFYNIFEFFFFPTFLISFEIIIFIFFIRIQINYDFFSPFFLVSFKSLKKKKKTNQIKRKRCDNSKLPQVLRNNLVVVWNWFRRLTKIDERKKKFKQTVSCLITKCEWPERMYKQFVSFLTLHTHNDTVTETLIHLCIYKTTSGDRNALRMCVFDVIMYVYVSCFAAVAAAVGAAVLPQLLLLIYTISSICSACCCHAGQS